jgi:hypothetical protein
MVVRTICEICLSDVDDGGEGWGGILMMHKGVRRRCLVVVRAMGNICLNVVDEESEVVLCPILYCIDVFSTYLGKILDFVVVLWSFIFISHVSRLIVEFI